MRGIIDFFTGSIQRRMLSSFTIVSVLVLAMVVGGFYQLNQVRNTAVQIPEDSAQLAEFQNLILALTSLEANLERFFVIGGAQFREDIDGDLAAMSNALAAQEADNDLATAELAERSGVLANEIGSLLGTEYADLSSREVNEKIISVYSQIDNIKALAQELSAQELSQLQNSALEQEDVTSNVIIQFLVLGTLAILVVVGASVAVTRSIALPLAGLAATATEIAEGNLQAEVPVVNRKDEVGQLSAVFKSMTDQLRNFIATLEERVASRTQRLEVVASLSEQLNAILDFDLLLLELVNQVKDTFGYYHTHVYVIDEESQDLVMAAGAGKAGIQMKVQGHRISVEAPTSLVARAARTNQIVSVENVREAPDWLPNPLLPDTYSEMAVPIVLEGQVVGVLDVQQDKVAGLDEGDAGLLRSLANQVAVAINNARLFAEVETALADARATQEKYLEQAWEKVKSIELGAEHLHVHTPSATTLPETTMVDAKQMAFAQDAPVFVTLDSPELAGLDAESETPDSVTISKSIVAPVIIGGKKVGALQMHRADADNKPETPPWNEEDLALIETILGQVAQSAENLRLFEDTRGRASREQIIRQITEKMRAATSVEELIQTATNELGQQLNAGHVVLDLGLTTDEKL